MSEIDEFIDTFVRLKRKETGNSSYDLNEQQREAIRAPNEPLWILAGPGTGKTEVLTLRCLRYLIVDKVPARSIILTTFTKKAAEQLSEKISKYLGYFRKEFGTEEYRDIVESELRVGTLHGLAYEILSEGREDWSSNFRLMDERQQWLFVYERSKFINNPAEEEKELAQLFWDNLRFITLGKKPCGRKKGVMPSRKCRAKELITVLNRAIESGHTPDTVKKIDNDKFGPLFYNYLSDAMRDYQELVAGARLCDQSLLQRKFLDFLKCEEGKTFLTGGSPKNQGIKCLLIDEYQDTNLVQEMIYFEIAKSIGGNICVVGDDDQALYRFRGGNVELMTAFGQRLKKKLSLCADVKTVQLLNNYRSHSKIVEWVNHQITYEPVMRGARAPNKKPLVPKSSICGNGWTPVGTIVNEYKRGTKTSFCENLAPRTAHLIKSLIDGGIVSDPSQICVLSSSTRVEKNGFIGMLHESLEALGIDTYNPTSKNYHESAAILQFLGVLFTVLDSDRTTQETISYDGYVEAKDYVNKCKAEAGKLLSQEEYGQLRQYVEKSKKSIEEYQPPGRSNRIKYVTERGERGNDPPTLRSVCYNILNYKPFIDYIDEGVEESRELQSILEIINSYSTMPQEGKNLTSRDVLNKDSTHPSAADRYIVSRLYTLVIDMLCMEGMDEPSDGKEVSIPAGKIPIMTVHSSKGLEFPIVFVYNFEFKNPSIGPGHIFENMFCSTEDCLTEDEQKMRAQQDKTRLYYVAYSRAKYALIIVGAEHGKNKPFVWGGTDRESTLLRNMAPILGVDDIGEEGDR